MKKETKKTTSKEFDKDREFGVILERIHSDIKIIGEDLSTLKDRVDGISTNQATTLEKITLLEISARKTHADIQTIKADIADIKATLKGHSERLTHLESVK